MACTQVTCKDVPIHTHAHAYTNTYTNAYTRIHRCIDTYKRTHVCTQMHTDTEFALGSPSTCRNNSIQTALLL